MKLETVRNNSTGEIIVKAIPADVTVTVQQDGRVTVVSPCRTVSIPVIGKITIENNEKHAHADEPSPRAACSNRKRGSR
jgi:hypothetical protein